MFGLSSIISPNVALKMVKVAIEKTVKQKIERFDIIYKQKEKVIDFRLYNFTVDNIKHDKMLMKYDDEGGKFSATISGLLKEHCKDFDLNYAVISFPANTVDLFYIEKDEKIKRQIVL